METLNRHTEMDAAIYQVVNDFFTKTIAEHGPTARGVDWNSETAQEIRFNQLIKVVNPNESFSLNDYGCGYGALLTYCIKRGLDLRYLGYDIVQAMIDEAIKTHAHIKQAKFVCDTELSVVSDYSIACGVFNLKGPISNEKWTRYVCDSLKKIDQVSTRGFAFNLLTKYSDADKMRPDLYYGDPCFYFDFCKRSFARNVALLHDYGQYEFTILVQKLN
jgi:SAM-dependent methyltransferase